MAPPSDNPPDRDPDYESEDDSDFAPEPEEATADGAQGDDGLSSDSESEDDSRDGAKPTTGRRKRATADETEDVGFENSGDEAVIAKGRKKRRKQQEKDGAATGATAEGDDDDDGGEGGFVKTRRMRALEKAERRHQATLVSGPVTIDVDAVWAQMMAASMAPASQQGPAASGGPDDNTAKTTGADEAVTPSKRDAKDSDMIKIKRTYNFAGKVHVEEKLVHRESAEARLYLAQVGSEDAVADGESASPAKRKVKKAFRSAFEPVLDPAVLASITGAAANGSSKRKDLNLGLSAMQQRAKAMAANAKKLNTVEKSRVDWAGFVDREGIKDELDAAGRSKHSYASRQAFLARVDAKRDQKAREARLAGRVLS